MRIWNWGQAWGRGHRSWDPKHQCLKSSPGDSTVHSRLRITAQSQDPDSFPYQPHNLRQIFSPLCASVFSPTKWNEWGWWLNSCLTELLAGLNGLIYRKCLQYFCYELNVCSSPNSYVEVLTSNTSECDYIRRKGLKEVIKVKWSHSDGYSNPIWPMSL